MFSLKLLFLISLLYHLEISCPYDYFTNKYEDQNAVGLVEAVKFVTSEHFYNEIMLIHNKNHQLNEISSLVKAIQTITPVTVWKSDSTNPANILTMNDTNTLIGFSRKSVVLPQNLMLYYLEDIPKVDLNQHNRTEYRSKYRNLLIFRNEDYDPEDLKQFHHLTWRLGLFHVTVMLLNKTKMGDKGAIVYSYFPFENKACGDVFDSDFVLTLGIFNFSAIGTSGFYTDFLESRRDIYFRSPENPSRFFPSKIPLNMHGCPLKVGYLQWSPNIINWNSKDEPGIECEFILSVAKYANLKLKLSHFSLKNVQMNQSDEILLMGDADLKSKQLDLLVGGIFTSQRKLSYFETTDWFLPNFLVWIVPSAREISKSQTMWILVNKMYLELIIVSIALMCTSSIIYLLESLNFNYATDYSRKKRMSFGRIAFILYRASVGTSSPSLTILTSTRFMLGIWFLCSFILNSFYNTTLISFITRPGLEEQMTCLDDIVKNQLHIRFPPVYNAVMHTFPHSDYIRKNFKPTSIGKALKLTASQKAITFLDRMKALYISLQWIDEKHERPISMLNVDRIAYWTQIAMYRNYPLYERINEFVRRSNFGGFWVLVPRKYRDRRMIRTIIRRQIIIQNYLKGINNNSSMELLNAGFQDTLKNDETTESIEDVKIIDATEKDLVNRFLDMHSGMVTLEHLEPAFDCLFIGVILSAAVLLLEILQKRYQLTRRIKKLLHNLKHNLNPERI